jgi:pimeloyl-ACP methyl ester carboxylesterase
MKGPDWVVTTEGTRLRCSGEPDSDGSPPSVLSVHGGGPSDRHSAAYLAPAFRQAGLGMLGFDCSGQGESSGDLKASSLAHRRAEALTVAEAWGCRPRVLVGTSMGGAVAASLLDAFPLDTLLLFCPAAYDRNAWTLPFGAGFTEAIRRPESFQNNDLVDRCRSFRGRVLFVQGDGDDVIPRVVPDLYRQALVGASEFRFVSLAGCPHPIHRWAAGRPEVQRLILGEVRRFLDGSPTGQTPGQ